VIPTTADVVADGQQTHFLGLKPTGMSQILRTLTILDKPKLRELVSMTRPKSSKTLQDLNKWICRQAEFRTQIWKHIFIRMVRFPLLLTLAIGNHTAPVYLNVINLINLIMQSF